MSKYILLIEHDEEIYVTEKYSILKDAEPGSWAYDNRFDESDNPFDFIQSGGNWAVESKKERIFVIVNNVGLILCDESYYSFTDFKNVLYEHQVDFIYHKDSKGNWLLVWSRQNE